MVSRINSFAFSGIEAVNIEIECQISAGGMANFIIVGLPDKAVAESRERIKSAFSAMSLAFPYKRVVINLTPADIYKEGSHFDLPISLAILAEMEILPKDEIAKFFALGEISLDGRINPVSGVLPAAVTASSFDKGIICPKENAREALWASSEIEILGASSLIDIINHFRGIQPISKMRVEDKILENFESDFTPDFIDVKGQENAKRAAEITASGGHNLLMNGPPGSGKSMIASRIIGILPDLSPKEILETSIVFSVAGYLKDGKLINKRPYRNPHHNISMPAMVGGGKTAKPGEISLSHNGVLFLDELPEFPRQVLDSLRQPLENKTVSISRVNSHVTYPAKFQLVAAMNPCKCGYLGDASRACSIAPKCGTDYQMKISGPLLDRIDIHIEVPAQNPLKAYNESKSEASSVIKQRVLKTREIQSERYKNLNFELNSDLIGEDLEKFAILESEAKQLLEKAVDKFKFSMRGYAKVLRLSRTIADMEASDIIKKHHLAEAISYRQIG
jgi:magnesium chelatase family protein